LRGVDYYGEAFFPFLFLFQAICILDVDGAVMMMPENLMGRVDEVK
jgi:hypothetical protein